jgi:DNA polymerase III delta prime subunit
MKEPKKQKNDYPHLKRPIIFICNDFYSKALMPLKELVLPIKVESASIDQLSSRVNFILKKENVTNIKSGVVNKLIEACAGDARSCLNTV